jgi:CHAT domain-containing protein
MGDAPLASHAASNLANVVFALGEPGRADSLHQAALVHDTAVGDAGAVVVDLENIALLLVSRGDYSAAADTVAAATALCGKRGLERERIYLLITRAKIARDVNDLDEAARALAEAATAARRLGDRSAEGQALQLRGEVEALRGDFALARTHLASAASVHRETGEVLCLLETNNLRAAAELFAGDLDAAERAADAADSLSARIGSVTEGARTLWIAARIAADRGRLDDARSLLDRAAARLPPHFEQDLAWQIEMTRAAVAEQSGDPAGALSHLMTGIDIVEDVRRGVTGHRERSRYVEDKEALYRNAVSLFLEQGRPDAAFAVAERARARAFLDLLVEGKGESLLRGAATRVEDLRAARQRVAVLVEEWGSLEEGGILPEETEAASALGAELRDAYAEYERAVRPALRAAGEDAGAEPADLRALQKALPGGWALADFFFARDGLVAFVVTRSAFETFELRLSRSEIADVVRVARALVEDASSDRGRLDHLLGRLSEALLDPLLASGILDDCARLVIVPHAELHLVPFAALPVSRSGANGTARLIDRCEVAVVPSASLLVVRDAERRGGPASRAEPLLAIGGIAGGRGPSLPYSKDEVERIAAASGVLRPVTLLLGRRAEETAWKEAAPRAGRIHIAAHGRAARGSPLFSSLEMLPTPKDDGHLEVHEILGLRLTADVAVLSGCETGQASGYTADLPPGDEIVGLSRAFLAAGVRTVIATLWPVADRAAADFMVEFHSNLTAFDAIGALARTQRRWARSSDHRAHPFYWASVVALGCGG